jgi:hypothetical protein
MGTGQNRTHMIYVTADQKQIYTTNVSSATVAFWRKSRYRRWDLRQECARIRAHCLLLLREGLNHVWTGMRPSFRWAQATKVIITHGWPGSIIEQLKVPDYMSPATA